MWQIWACGNPALLHHSVVPSLAPTPILSVSLEGMEAPMICTRGKQAVGKLFVPIWTE